MEKDTNNAELVNNNLQQEGKEVSEVKRKSKQFSTTIPIELYEEMERKTQLHGLDRTQVITILFERLVADDKYTISFLFPNQSLTQLQNGQKNNTQI